MYNIYLYIALPLAALAVIASLLLLLSPLLNDKLKIFLHVLIIAASIIYPTVAGITIIEKSPTSLLIFVQNDNCVTIFEGHTNTKQTFDIEQSFDGRNITRNTNLMESMVEPQKFEELAEKGYVFIQKITEIKMKDLSRKFRAERKVCFFCASESNLCRRTLFSLGSDADENCKIEECPFVKYSEWSQWSQCSKACGKGIQVRERKCASGKKCVRDENVEKIDCNKEECGQWRPWRQWTDCNRVCGGGTRNRTRDCEEGKLCDGARDEQEYCNTQECQGIISCGRDDITQYIYICRALLPDSVQLRTSREEAV